MRPVRLAFAIVGTMVLAATACGRGDLESGPGHRRVAQVSPNGEPSLALENAPAPLVTPTYDGSGQAVEPTVLHFAEGWRGHHYWMVMSPYPHSKAALENPSLLVSEDGLTWRVPPGLTNPIALPVRGTLSDATVVYDDVSDALWVYYLDDVVTTRVDFESMHRMTSADGLHWSAPEPIIAGPNYPIESPSVVKVGDTFTMWTVDSGPMGCKTQHTTVTERTSHDGVHWTAPRAAGLTQPGYVIWHLNMIPGPTPGRFLSLFNAYPEGAACDGTSLFLGESDGQRWVTQGEAVLSPGPRWDDQEIYRSSLLYEPATSLLRVWYSGRNRARNIWHVGYTEGLLPLQ